MKHLSLIRLDHWQYKLVYFCLLYFFLSFFLSLSFFASLSFFIYFFNPSFIRNCFFFSLVAVNFFEMFGIFKFSKPCIFWSKFQISLNFVYNSKSAEETSEENIARNGRAQVQQCLYLPIFDNSIIQMQICFLIKIKIENWQKYGQAYNSMV